jgi:hypothetical protein
MGQGHATRTAFDASAPSYGFGHRYIQGNGNGPAGGGGNQFYSWYQGLGAEYPATGGGSYGMYIAIPRNPTTPYMSVRYNEGGGLGSWLKIAAGYADTSGTAGNITAYTINQSVGTGNNVTFNLVDATQFRDSNNTAYYLNPNGNSNFDTVVTGVMYFASNRNTDSSSAPLQAYSNNGSGATMAFHRSGAFAVNFGLDSDNVMRIGGWSASANRWQLDMSGNMTVAGNVTAYSDIRLKDNIRVIDHAIEKVKAIRGVYFTRNDQDDKLKLHTGIIAQEVELVLPEVVSEDNEGKKNVAYGNMVGLLIEAIKEQQKQIDELKALIKK